MTLTPTVKDSAGKIAVARGSLLRFPLALQAVAEVSTFGCRKYNAPLGDMGYLRVTDGYASYTDAIVRHLLDEQREVRNPQDGNVLHAAQVAWNALARLEILLAGTDPNAPKLGPVLPVDDDIQV